MLGGAAHAAIRSELTVPLLPQVIAARFPYACGTLMLTGARLARMTRPALRQ